MISILLLSRFPPEKDGVGDYTYELSQHLSRYCNVYVLTFGNYVQEKNIFRFIKGDNRYQGYAVAKGIEYLKNELGIELVHFQTASFSFKRNFYTFALFNNIPLVTTLHEVLTLRQFHYLPFVYPVYLRSKKLIVLSKSMVDLLIRKHRIDSGKIVFMHHGADIKSFNPKVSRKPFLDRYNLEDAFNIVFFGFIGKGKGIDILIKAFSLVEKEIKDARLIIAGGPKGDNERVYFNYLKHLAKSLGIERKIFFTDYVPLELLPSCIASADIFVLPYLGGIHKSGPLHRALATGRAIIASDIPSFREVITHGYNGYLFQPANVQGLANSILELYRNEELRIKLASNARKFAEENLDWEIIAKKTLKVYEEVLTMEKD